MIVGGGAIGSKGLSSIYGSKLYSIDSELYWFLSSGFREIPSIWKVQEGSGNALTEVGQWEAMNSNMMSRKK